MILPIRDQVSVSHSINVDSIQELLFGSSLELDKDFKPSVDTCGNILHIYLKSTSTSGKCPCCGENTSFVNSAGFRHPQWMPVNGMTTYAHITLKRYICKNSECTQRTFVEQLDYVRSNQHRSDLVNLVIFAISIFCSDIVTAMICREMGISISHDSANRILEKISIEDDTDVEFIGVDDVSLRKGQTYHTVIYDGNDHHLLALLDGRDGEALKEWLKEHPKVSVVAMDRASAYASAITEILPEAVQVADRFHILQNLIGYLNEIFKADIPARIFIRNGEVLNEPPQKDLSLKTALNAESFQDIDYDNSPPIDKSGNVVTYFNKQRGDHKARDKERSARRQERYERIMQMRKDWENGEYDSKSSLAQAYGMSVANARRYLNMPDKEVEKIKELKERGKRKTDMDGYMNIVYKMLADGQDPAFIYSYILHIGYAGSLHSLVNHIKTIARNNFGIKLNIGFPDKCSYPEDTVIIKRFDVLKYITMKDKTKMEDTDVARYYSLTAEKFPQVKLCAEIWDGFYAILMGGAPDKLDGFLEKYKASPIEPFINGIKMDIAPVKNAISTSVSSGFVEGGNCRYKATKRLMFGRSGLHHLFLKTYATSIIMRTGKKARDLINKWFRKDS
ncbi:ISL3 family transposase [Lachnospiraceae bacterium 56-18]